MSQLRSVKQAAKNAMKTRFAITMMLAVALPGAAMTIGPSDSVARSADLPTFDTAKPDAVLVDGAADAAKRVKLVPSSGQRSDVTVLVRGEDSISKVELVWNVAFPKDALFYCGAWERTYSNAGWYKMDDKEAPQRGWKPWYFLVNDGERTDGYGLKVQPSVFGAWKVEPGRVVLSLDLRAGTNPLRLKGRELGACVLVNRKGNAGETPFAAAREFCRVMCPKPRLPKSPVYGYNDWYCAYGNNTATNFLADAEVFLSCCKGLKNRPYVVVDYGWQRNDFKNTPDDGLWAGVRPKWGMPMDEVARRVKAMGGKPGIWYRPFWKCRGLPAMPSAEMRDRVKREMTRFREWGMELVKIDFITYDWGCVWGYAMSDTPMCAKNCNWDDSRTTAEVVRDLYTAMREGAGDDVIIIVCNALDHFAAGLFEQQRTGDDTSGKEWNRTYQFGVNTLGHRMHHDRTFYALDGDCIGLVSKGDVPWEKNRLWLDLLANSGTALFVSWKRELMDDDVRAALTEACRKASEVQPVAEPLDWMQCLQPTHWRFGDREKTYDWNAVRTLGKTGENHAR